jgi:hypothetical protein
MFLINLGCFELVKVDDATFDDAKMLCKCYLYGV